MTDQEIIYLLALLGWFSVMFARYTVRDTIRSEWFKENWKGGVSGLVAVAMLILIGPGDDVDLGSYVARSWAAGLAGTTGYLASVGIQGRAASDRRTVGRAEAQLRKDQQAVA